MPSPHPSFQKWHLPPAPPLLQEDIINRRSMADSRAAERAFFESHPEYIEVASQVGGGEWVGGG